LERRTKDQLLSPDDQLKLNQAKKKLEDLQNRWNYLNLFSIDQQLFQTELKKIQDEKDEYFQQLRKLHHQHDLLIDKLNWLRTLVRAGENKQLLELVRLGKI